MSLAKVCATCLEMSMWSLSGGVTLKVFSNIKLRCYPKKKSSFHALPSYRAKRSIYIITKKMFTKWQWVNSLQIKKNHDFR